MKLKLLKNLKRSRTQENIIPTFIIMVCVMFFGITSIISLRSNNLKMVSLRNALYTADKNGDDVENALRNLRAHVYTHMNTDLVNGTNGIRPPIQLLYTYQRKVDTERARVSESNAQINKTAQTTCEEQFGRGQVAGRLQCVEAYNLKNGLKETPIPDSFYKFDFVSPRWSPDKAGFSILISVFFSIWLVLRLFFKRFL